MKSWAILALTAATMALTTVNARTDLAQSVVGIWRIVAAKSKAVDGGAEEDLYGSKPLGQLIYDSTGHMSVQLLKPNLSKCGSLDRRACPNPQAREAFDNYLGYWGHYILVASENSVLHEIEGASVPDWVGTSQKRLIQVSGKRLTITAPAQQVNGVQSTVVLEWERE